MRRIYGIGETVYDIIFKDGSPQAAKPGGSVLNSMVSLGRIGLPASFISEYGNDDVGSLIDKFLNVNGVDTSSVYRYNNANTSLALAFLDERNDAHYTFFKDFPEKRMDIDFPSVCKDDIVQYGSFFAVGKEIRPVLMKFIKSVLNKGGLILYDPNFRKSHVSELEKLRPLIIENMKMAVIVRGSDEDFRNIFNAENADEAWEIVKNYTRCFVYTSSADGVFVRTESFSGTFPVNKINPVSTIGAGDNFNAGMIAAIFNNVITGDELCQMGEEKWAKVISSGVEFATDVCLSYENYISHAFASRYLSASRDQI
jgi:fructokinase